MENGKLNFISTFTSSWWGEGYYVMSPGGGGSWDWRKETGGSNSIAPGSCLLRLAAALDAFVVVVAGEGDVGPTGVERGGLPCPLLVCVTTSDVPVSDRPNVGVVVTVTESNSAGAGQVVVCLQVQV